jgi:RecJ-like exonuclease
MTEDISLLNQKAAEIVLSMPKPTRIRVISHYDADGISAAGILCTALFREGYDFHASLMRNPFNKGLERLSKEDNSLIIFSDMGSGQIETLEKLNSKIIIFDHHQYLRKKVKENVLQINANICGINGNYEASGASLCYFFAKTLNEKNEDLCFLGLAGAIGDKQHIGGLKGFNKNILEDALKKGILKERTKIKLYGSSIFDALYFSIDPFYKNFSGNENEIKKALSKLGIESDKKIEELNDEEITKLHSLLMFKLIKKGIHPNILETTIRKRYYSETFGHELERFADILDACGKNGQRGLGLSICLGNKDTFNEALVIEKEYKQKILNSLGTLEDNIQSLNGLNYFYSDSSSLGGVVAGIAMMYLVDGDKPLFSVARKKDEIHVSCRGSQSLVDYGLDLGGAMKKIASELGGFGGGHKIAAGATISIEKENDFLKKSDELITNQLKG